MNLSSIEERRIRHNEIKQVTAALYEAKVKDYEILRVLMKICNINRESAMSMLQFEKIIWYPCRELTQYLILEKGFDAHDANVFTYNIAKPRLESNTELRKLSPAKLFDAINKDNK
ncbi:hypothetical protein [Bacillus sp. AFS017336]|uniref:hypothetical protein n=1 Tax=Bacillus sp. AFS017336 TaxID=2033489 RepID=UPI000BF1F945|nr:hypothetical protein [Bacillus sp. AFS017336]PEK99498.1 hypothetical protein CN601_23805 [Bacillus sp. AFS017336]